MRPNGTVYDADYYTPKKTPPAPIKSKNPNSEQYQNSNTSDVAKKIYF